MFFFKQKAAYEWRMSDWSSDVCSSDLQQAPVGELDEQVVQPVQRSVPAGLLDQVPAVRQPQLRAGITAVSDERQVFAVAHQSFGKLEIQIGIASCRERVCQYV